MRVALFVVLLIAIPAAQGQERIANLENSIRVEYQYFHTSDFYDSEGRGDIGETDSHVLLLSGVYSINERWKIFATIPYVERRQKGGELTGGVHNPVTDFVEFEPPDLRFIDDGSYHGGFQDFHAGVQYLAYQSPLVSISPHVALHVPITDYPIYGGAAIGRNLDELHFGVSLELTPYFSDWVFQADVTYAVSEDVLGYDLNYWLVYLSASYFVSPQFVPRVYVVGREAPNAVTWPEDLNYDNYDSELGWRHDQAFKHSGINAGIGFDYLMSERHTIAATLYRSFENDNSAKVDYAFTVALTRRF